MSKPNNRDIIEIIGNAEKHFADLGHPIPGTHNKTAYMKACWLLNVFQKVKMVDEDLQWVRQTIKNDLTYLREHHNAAI